MMCACKNGDERCALSWFVPELPVRYCDRSALTARCAPTRRRATFIAAPGGFGKTTLLAAACRAETARGVPVAWLALADGESGATLDAYLAFAFHHAGIDLPAPPGAGEVSPIRNPWRCSASSSPPRRRACTSPWRSAGCPTGSTR